MELQRSPGDRFELGRAQRERVPLEDHAQVVSGNDRADPLSILAEQDKSRVPDLIPIRYGRMSRTPFTFFRGAAAVMAADLAEIPRSGLSVELCGDAHLGNFRWFRAPDRDLVFDLNDFDETLQGPFEWDVKRLAASIAVAARVNGFPTDKSRATVRYAMRSYHQSLAEISDLDPLALYYYRFDAKSVLERVERYGKKQRRWKEGVLDRASRRNSLCRSFIGVTVSRILDLAWATVRAVGSASSAQLGAALIGGIGFTCDSCFSFVYPGRKV